MEGREFILDVALCNRCAT